MVPTVGGVLGGITVRGDAAQLADGDVGLGGDGDVGLGGDGGQLGALQGHRRQQRPVEQFSGSWGVLDLVDADPAARVGARRDD